VKSTKLDIKATFKFIAKYPIQMIIGGGILIIILGFIIKATGASFTLQKLMDVGTQTVVAGGVILGLGVIVLLTYWLIRSKQF
jgi:hypothetical protein